jgi:hypothetical protein
MGLRRIGVLVRGLPQESLTVRVEDPAAATYSLTDELLASLIEVVDATALRTASVTAGAAGAKWKPGKPIQVPRPWAEQRKTRRKATAAELAAMFGTVRHVEGG